MRIQTVFGLFLAFPFAALAQQDATAALSGRVVDDSGRAIARQGNGQAKRNCLAAEHFVEQYGFFPCAAPLESFRTVFFCPHAIH